MFKKFVNQMITAETAEEVMDIFGEADRAFQMDKISWKDQQTLLRLADKISTLLEK